MSKIKQHGIFPPNFHDKLNIQNEEKRNLVEKELTNAAMWDLAESPIKGGFDLKHLADIHQFIFEDISSYAGSVRNYGLEKGGFTFADKRTMDWIFEKEVPESLQKLEKAKNSPERFAEEMATLHTRLDEAHPFREGNGRSTRVFLQQLAEEKGYKIDLDKITSSSKEWVEICKKALGCQAHDSNYQKPDPTPKEELFKQIVTPEHQIDKQEALHPDALKLQKALEEGAKKLSPEQRAVYNERAAKKVSEVSKAMTKKATLDKQQDNEK